MSSLNGSMEDFKEKYHEVFYPERTCPCPHCVLQRMPRWPCGRPRREWDMPVPMPTVKYEQGVGPTYLCN
jgi:hypothetical protein